MKINDNLRSRTIKNLRFLYDQYYNLRNLSSSYSEVLDFNMVNILSKSDFEFGKELNIGLKALPQR